MPSPQQNKRIAMNRATYESTMTSEIERAISLLIEQFPQLTGREVRLRSVLAPLAQRAASNSAAFELLNLKTAEELADDWRVTPRRARAIIANRHERFGGGRQVGKTWMLSAGEWERIEIDTSRRRKAQ